MTDPVSKGTLETRAAQKGRSGTPDADTAARSFDAELRRASGPADQRGGAALSAGPGSGEMAADAVRTFQDIRMEARAVAAAQLSVETASALSEADLSRQVALREMAAPPLTLSDGSVSASLRGAGLAPVSAPLAAARSAQPGPVSITTPRAAAPAPAPTFAAGNAAGADGAASEARPAPRPGGPASGGRMSPQFVSLAPSQDGLNIRIRTGARNSQERARIEGEVAGWLAVHGIRIATLNVDAPLNRFDIKREGS